MLLVLVFVVSPWANAADDIDWKQHYYNNWYPTDPELLHQSRQFIDNMLPDHSVHSLLTLSLDARNKVVYATLIYLRSAAMLQPNADHSSYARLVIDLAITLQKPIAEAEGYYFITLDRVARQQSFNKGDQYLKRALNLLSSAKYTEDDTLSHILLTRLYILTGQLNLEQHHYINAIESAETALIFSESSAIPQLKINAMFILGEGQFGLRQYDLAIKAFYDALNFASNDDYPSLRAKAMQLIGMVYKQQGKTENAIEHLQLAAADFQALGYTAPLAITLRTLADIYKINGNYHQAMVIYLNALEYERELNRAMGVAITSASISDVYRVLGNQTLANEYLVDAEKLFRILKNEMGLLRIRLMKAQMLSLKGQIDEALITVEDVAAIIEDQPNSEFFAETQTVLIDLYQRSGQFEKANTLLNNKLKAMTQRLSFSLDQRLSQIQSIHTQETLQSEISKLQLDIEESENNVKQYINYATWLFVIIVLSIGSILGLRRKLQLQRNDLNQAIHSSTHHPMSDLQNASVMYKTLDREIKQIQRLQENWYASGADINQPKGIQIIVVRIPTLHTIHEQLGMDSGSKMEMKFGNFLKSRFPEERIFQPRDDVIAIVAESSALLRSAEQVIDTLAGFSPQGLSTQSHLSMALINYPFLPKNSKAVDVNLVGEILLLGLSVASNIASREQADAWIGLEAIDAIPISLFQSNPRDNTLLAIEQGLIKVFSNFEKNKIHWPEQSFGASGVSKESENS